MKKLLAVALCAALMLVGVGALADYPEKPVECMVQWAAGGGADLAFRALAEVFPKYANGQQLVIKNVPGASGATGCVEFKETAVGDGYQIMHWSNAHVSKVHMSIVDYDNDSFRHVAQIVESANYLLVQKDAKWQTIEEFVADVLANPGMITVANAGIGGGNHIAALLFEEAIGGELAHITYDGGAGEVTGLLAGEVDAAMCNTPEGMPNVDADQFRILCSFASKPFKAYPDVPLACQSDLEGLNGLVIEQWRGVSVPLDTPDDICKKLESILEQCVADEDFIAACDSMNIVARFRNSEEFTEFSASEDARFEELIKSKGFGDRYGQ